MPKKTKREKIIAEYRRRLSTVSDNPRPTPDASVAAPSLHTNATNAFTFTGVKPKKEHSDTLMIDPQEFTAIKKDLAVTLIITISILISQIALWRVIG